MLLSQTSYIRIGGFECHVTAVVCKKDMWNEPVFFANLGVRMYGRNRKRNILYKRDSNFRIFFPRTDHRNVLEFFATFGKIKKK